MSICRTSSFDDLERGTFSGSQLGRKSVCREGHTVKIYEADGAATVQYFTLEEGAVLLEPDVREYFPDSEAVNKALRGLIALIPQTRQTIKTETE